ncbi:MAG: nuclease-related domain-containing protein [Actinomycetota bacterium]
MIVVVLALLLVVVSVGAAVLAMSERQFVPQADPRPTADRHGTPPDVSTMPATIAAGIEGATRTAPRNSSEARAVGAMRHAYELAVDGDFEREAQAALNRIRGVRALHDVRFITEGGPVIDHVVITSNGVVVVDSVVRAAKVALSEHEVLIGRGRDQRPDHLIDDMLWKTKAVLSVVEPVPVTGVIVFRDLLSLPEEVRSGTAVIQGVALMTLSHLEAYLVRPGPVDDLRAVMASLRAELEPALPGSRAARSLLTGSDNVPPPR